MPPTDLGDASQTWLNDVARSMNGRPARALGWKTPAEAMAEEIAAFRSTAALDVWIQARLGRKNMLTTAVTSTISKRTAYDRDAEWPPLASWHLSKPADPVVKIAEQVVYVCFPVVLPGEDGRVIPFGRYHLAARRQSRPQSGRPHQAMLVNGDNGARIGLSAQQLNAIAQDPDVEIY